MENEDIGDILNRNGVRNENDFNIFVALIESAKTNTYLECLLKTTDANHLNRLKENNQVALILKDALIEAENNWDSNLIVHVIDVLSKIPFSLSILKRHALGIKLKDIINKATVKPDINVIEKGKLLKKQWMRQDNKEKRSIATSNGLSKNKPVVSGQERPVVSANGLSKNKPVVSSQGLIAKTTPNVIRKPTHRLSIDKEPPKKVSKAMEHPQYIIDLIKEQSKHDIKTDSTQQSSIPLYHVSNTPHIVTTPPQIITTPPQIVTTPSQVLTPPPHITSPNKMAFPFHQPQFTRHIIKPTQDSPALTHIISPKEKKKVRFASRLSTTREYTPEPDEDKEETAGYITTPWYKPWLLELGDIEKPQPINSNEMILHDKREQTTLCKVYTSVKYIPNSPEEPDELPHHNNDTPIIPNYDTLEVLYVG